MSPSIRFLFLVVGGWILIRAASLLLLDPAIEPAAARVAAAQPHPDAQGSPAPLADALASSADVASGTAPVEAHRAIAPIGAASFPARHPAVLSIASPIVERRSSPAPAFASPASVTPPAMIKVARLPATAPARPPRATLDRLSASAWGLVRPSLNGDALATGGTLGGSQAGIRLRYALTERLAVAVRASAPLSRPLGGEAALGLTVTPVATVPVHVTVERRLAVGRGGGRSAFAAFAEGGIYERPLPFSFKLNGYAQAGVVGARRHDLFADGAVAATRAIAGPVAAGAGVWAGVQPGLSRVDAGPSLSLTLGAGVRAHLDWRFRIGGSAAPESGPALTIGRDF